MKKTHGTIKVSVTQLADFACRGGDLSFAGVVGPSAREGMRAHKKLQNQRKKAAGQPDWLCSELRVSCKSQVVDRLVQLGGRIDLVDTHKHLLTEIKTTLVPADKLQESQRAIQWAQLYLYGYVYLRSCALPETMQLECDTTASVQADNSMRHTPSLESLELELVHINILGATESSEVRIVAASDLIAHANVAMHCYVSWIKQIEHWREKMVASTAQLPFPFANFRQGQRDMAAAIYRACRDAQPLMCEAPTGIGKTISSLFPAVKSMGEGAVNQLVYLTAKVGGRVSAQEALTNLRDGGLVATSIQIRAKETTCFCSNGSCELDATGACPMSVGFFDRLPQARDELLKIGTIDNDFLDEVAWNHQLCPFELVLQMLPWVQVVITDYNYVFDPLVRLGHFAAERKDTLLLVDEAHNLIDRSRSMFSAELNRAHCMDAATECRQGFPVVAQALDSLSRVLLNVTDPTDKGVNSSTQAPDKLAKSVSAALEQINTAMALPAKLGEKTSQLWKALCRYMVINELFSAQHRCIVENSHSGRKRQVIVKLYCLDASSALGSSYRQFRSVILFSATLRPGVFYRDTLGLKADTGYLQLCSPFLPQNCFRAVVDWIDTRYRHRQASLHALVSLLYESTVGKAGNYLVFFPSYTYLEQVHALFKSNYPDCTTWVQARGQSRQEQQNLIDALDVGGHRIGFAIQGGVFGEGIDYKGDRLIGTLIVGTGLPASDHQNELIADHYRDSGHDGYDFTFRFPGFTRVLQTAGRLIRSETDTGFVLLVDSRFRQKGYRQLFPDDWVVSYPADQAELLTKLNEFRSNMRQIKV